MAPGAVQAGGNLDFGQQGAGGVVDQYIIVVPCEGPDGFQPAVNRELTVFPRQGKSFEFFSYSQEISASYL